MGMNRNIIQSTSTQQLTKKELIEMVKENYPDEEAEFHGQIAQMTTITMADGTQQQSILFGRILRKMIEDRWYKWVKG